MTPLAMGIARQLTIPKKDRDGYLSGRAGGIGDLVSDIHCFDVTDVLPLAEAFTERFKVDGFDETLAFLPAEKTWLEYSEILPDDGQGYGAIKNRHAILLQASPSDDSARIEYISSHEREQIGLHSYFNSGINGDRANLPLKTALGSRESRLKLVSNIYDKAVYRPDPFTIYALLAIINTPRLIGRRQHMPHRGLERRLRQSGGLIGKYPLHAWHELTLVAHTSRIDDSGISHEAHLTGRKCLHFCRQHIRIRNGRLELVSAHWRGDPALGIKQTRYRVVPPKA